MQLIKVFKNSEEPRYFSTVAKASKFLNASHSNTTVAIKFKNKCKGYNVEISEDVILTSEVDKYTNEKQ